MMKNAIRALAACVAAMFALAARADSETVGGVIYTYDLIAVAGNPLAPVTARITGVNPGAVYNVNIPDTLGGKPVTQIASSAFENKTGVRYVRLPDSVETIWNSAFKGCTSLERVWLSEKLESIKDYAFHGCSNLELVYFSWAPGLKAIGNQAFYGCSKLDLVMLPDGLNTLGSDAFKNCTSLEWAYLPAFFTDGDPRAKYFSGCPSGMVLTSRDIVGGIAWHFKIDGDSAELYPDYPNDNPAIDENTAGAIEIPSTLCNRQVTSIGANAFSSCYDITSVTIPSGVTSIGKDAFAYCNDLTSVTIPKSVTSIGQDAFEHTLDLATVYVEEGDAARVRGLFEASGYDVDEVVFDDGSEPVVPIVATWYTTRAEAFAAARKTGKKVFMICGRDTCGNTMYTKNYSCEVPAVKAMLVAKCVLWYTNCDTQEDENYYYYPNGSFALPLVCIIDPADDKHFIVRSTNYLEPEEILSMLAGIPYPATDDYADLDPFYPGEMTGYKVINPADIWNPLSASKAVTLMGALYYGNDVVGVLELKIGKMKNYQAKVSGTATMLDGKKYTIKSKKCGFGDTLASTLNLDIKGGGSMRVAIGSIGGVNVFSGEFDKWHVQTADVGGNWSKSTATVAVTIATLPSGILNGLLPTSETAVASGNKWSFGKAASVKWTKPKNGTQPVIYDAASGKGLVVDTSKGANLSGLKLTYTPKKGTFKGSFKAYALIGSGSATKLKKYTVSVNGVVVDGLGRGKATCKNPVISWPVTVE